MSVHLPVAVAETVRTEIKQLRWKAGKEKIMENYALISIPAL